MPREVKPQQWSETYPYDGGFALWDPVTRKQTGWCRYEEKAIELARDDEVCDDQPAPAPESKDATEDKS